jgi:hypothetical protein
MINKSMRMLEILLPKSVSDKSLSPKHAQKIDALQQRMNTYVDKIFDPKTTDAGREFLKSKLRDDYYELRDLIPKFHQVAEDEPFPTPSLKRYEIYDKQTGQTVPGGPYSSRVRASRVVDKKDNEYGAYRFGYRPVGGTLNEAVRKLPLTDKDFELVKHLMERPIPAAIAPIYICEIIDDDMLNDEIRSFEDTEPDRDCRPFIVEWIKRVMPDQMHRFGQEVADWKQKDGKFSPLHGYDPKEHSRGGHSGTGASGNAYGYA